MTPPPWETSIAALDHFEQRIRTYDYAEVLGDGAKGYEMRLQRLDEIAAAKKWVRQQRTQQGERNPNE
ncbi:MAG: hypothetical protein KAZ48_11780 [Candidatus Nanopelagicales bacterium]|nr:hypothetical protein [Candidatus Nanopelagicales bacterium]